jgi:hypothetical protein
MLDPCEGSDDDCVAGDIGAVLAALSIGSSLDTRVVVFWLATIVVKTSDGASTPSIHVVSSIPVGSIFSESVLVNLAASDDDWETVDIGGVAPCTSVCTLFEIVFDMPG